MGKNRPDVYYDAKGREHKRGHVFSSGRHHGHRHHRRHRAGWQKVLISIGLVLVIVLAVAFVGWRVLDAMGKRSLYKNVGEITVPTLAESESATQEVQAQEGEEWKPGWVRHNGSVYEYNDHILSFLFMGIDSENPVVKAKDGVSGGQADGLFLLVMNPDTKKIQILAINRNTMTELDVYDKNGNFVSTNIGQICLQHGYGDGMEQSCERQVKAVSNLLYNLPINGYFAINMGAIGQLNDAVGGVEVEVLETIQKENTYLPEGATVVLQGRDAFWYCKYRDKYKSGTSDKRLARQKQYLGKFGQQMKNKIMANPTSVVELYNTLTPYMVTDLDVSEVTYLAGQAGQYTFDDNILSMEGETIVGEQNESGFDQFIYDEDALYEQMIELFYRKVK